MKHLQVPLIYNLFPPLVGPCDRWGDHAAQAHAMGFNWIYFNPLFTPGLSGSLYAVKDYFHVNLALLPAGTQDDSIQVLEPYIRNLSDMGLHPMVDLVVNHTAIDSPLIAQHPTWFVRDERGDVQHPFAVDPQNPQHKTVWGDLAEVDNHHSVDRDELWAYWASVVRAYLQIGFEGFRCDAAYQVPAGLWQYLIQEATRVNPQAMFWAENLGCTVEQTRALRDAGFQYICNSSKWWNFADSWCLDQHRTFADMTSISFPETHDTERLAKETHGNEAIQRQRYAFAATFSAGVMMPIGYEYGFQTRLHVVDTRPDDWERPSWDLTAFIGKINELKLRMPLLQGEGEIRRGTSPTPEVCILIRQSGQAPGAVGWVLINTSNHHPVTLSPRDVMGEVEGMRWLSLTSLDRGGEFQSCPDVWQLAPAEVILATGEAFPERQAVR